MKSFDEITEEALEELPEFFREKLRNVEVLVQERPSEEIEKRMGKPGRTILGLYSGVPQPKRSVFAGLGRPDRIYIYREAIERQCAGGDKLKQCVKDVVMHEIGHHFGLSDEDMRRYR